MGVGEFIFWVFVVFCLYSLINKIIKLVEYNVKHNISLEENLKKFDEDIKDFKCSDFEDVFEDIKK